MSILYSLKVAVYNFFGTSLGKNMLKLLSRFIYVQNLKPNKTTKKNKTFLISITVDAEAGYTTKDNKRMWQKSQPEAYIGYYKGIENWRKLLNKYSAKATFFLSTNCFSAKGHQYRKVLTQLKYLLQENHEIGLHVHPDSDLALQKVLNKDFKATSARFYNKKEIDEIISASKKLIQKNLKINSVSFRWGNWALNADAVKALQNNGFKIDSSAVPGIKGHLNNQMNYDWSKVNKHYPWKLSLNDYQNTSQQNSRVSEIPIATFSLFWSTLRADPVYSELFRAAFDYYYKNANRSKKPFVFVVISHSIEGTHIDGSPTRVIKDMEEFIKYASKIVDVEFVTINEAYKRVN